MHFNILRWISKKFHISFFMINSKKISKGLKMKQRINTKKQRNEMKELFSNIEVITNMKNEAKKMHSNNFKGSNTEIYSFNKRKGTPIRK